MKVRDAAALPLGFLYLVFFVSGFAALVYQVVWQRALFAIYGVNIESVTIVVSAFMLGLGLGSFAGGKLSARPACTCCAGSAVLRSRSARLARCR